MTQLMMSLRPTARQPGRTARTGDRPTPEVLYTIDELAAHSGVPSRTIRYYQSKGTLPGPERRGRVAYYRADHVERLRVIAELQDRGLRLDAISDVLQRLEEGGDSLQDWLGMGDQLQAPWSDDRPIVLSEPDLLERVGHRRPGVLAELARLGLDRAPGQQPPGDVHRPQPGPPRHQRAARPGQRRLDGGRRGRRDHAAPDGAAGRRARRVLRRAGRRRLRRGRRARGHRAVVRRAAARGHAGDPALLRPGDGAGAARVRRARRRHPTRSRASAVRPRRRATASRRARGTATGAGPTAATPRRRAATPRADPVVPGVDPGGPAPGRRAAVGHGGGSGGR